MKERTTAFTKRVALLLIMSAWLVLQLATASNAVGYALCGAVAVLDVIAICNVLIAAGLLKSGGNNEVSENTSEILSFDVVVQHSSDMIGLATLEGKVLHLNTAGRELLGFGANEDLSGKSIAEFYPPAATRMLQEEVFPTIMKHDVWKGEMVILNGKRQEIPISKVVMLKRDAQGKPAYMATIIRDISRLKEVENAAQTAAAQAAQTEEVSLVMVVRCDPSGKWLHAPARLCKLLGYTEEELLGRRFQDVTHPDDLERLLQHCRRVQNGEIQSFEIEKRCLCKDGSYIWTYLNGTGVFDSNGTLLHFQAYMRNISDERKAEAKIGASERRFRSVFESPVMGTMLWRGFDLTDANECFLNMIGYTREEFLSGAMNWKVMTPPEFAYLDQAALVAIRETGRVEPYEKEYFHKDGSRVPILICPILSDEDGGGGVAFALDISARKRAETALRTTAERFMLIAEATNDALWDREIPSGKSWWNETYKRRFGFEGEVLPTLENWKSRIHPEDLERVLNTLKIAEDKTSREAWSAEYRYRLTDGTYAHVLDRAIILRDEKGEAYRIAGAMQDFTQRVKTEESIRRLADRLELVSRATNDSIWERDLRTGEGWWNDVYAARYGLEDGKLPSIPYWLSNVHPEDRQRVVNSLTESQSSGAATWTCEYRVRATDGSFAQVLDRALIVRDDTGVPIRVIGSTLDLTERVKLTEALQENQERYRLLFDNAPEAILVSDVETGFFIEHNAEAEKLFKMTTAELLQASPIKLSPERQPDGSLSSEKAMIYMKEALEGGSPRFEWVHCDKYDKPIPCEIWLTRLPSKDRKLVRGSLIDISGRKLLEEQLRQAQKMEAVGKLAGGIAHDFNNLLVAILGYGDLIREQAPAGSSQHMGAEQILIAANRAADLTRQLLAYSRKQILQPKIISLSKTVSDMHRLLERLIGEDIEFVQMLEAAGSVSADPGQIEQVIMNLVLNARDAMPKGGRLTIETMDVEFDESYKRQHGDVAAGPYVMLAVSDTGTGMSKEIVDRIFEPFFTTKEVGKGTGLGLSTVHGIVNQSGGHVFVYSEPGKGSTFKIYLPRIKAVNATEKPPVAPPASHGGETILIVEDENGVRALIFEVLRRAGYTVLQAANGNEALKVAAAYAGKIDLVVTDVVLPKMGGATVAKELQKQRPGVRVLFMSGYTENAVVHHGVLDTGIEYLQKPFIPSDFSRRVRSLLDKPLVKP